MSGSKLIFISVDFIFVYTINQLADEQIIEVRLPEKKSPRATVGACRYVLATQQKGLHEAGLFVTDLTGAEKRNRTSDLLITKPILAQQANGKIITSF
ncbi:hypothetical protein [Nevskia ramosa]|uniref:hypothetical protein n=1 Tax=Nevskia ramosa TaxID=64002 RepID=UPI002352A4D6|nr:hypothetical protein [Nevskia ramosa]